MMCSADAALAANAGHRPALVPLQSFSGNGESKVKVDGQRPKANVNSESPCCSRHAAVAVGQSPTWCWQYLDHTHVGWEVTTHPAHWPRVLATKHCQVWYLLSRVALLMCTTQLCLTIACYMLHTTACRQQLCSVGDFKHPKRDTSPYSEPATAGFHTSRCSQTLVHIAVTLHTGDDSSIATHHIQGKAYCPVMLDIELSLSLGHGHSSRSRSQLTQAGRTATLLSRHI